LDGSYVLNGAATVSFDADRVATWKGVENRDIGTGQDGGGELSLTLSTRGLVRWASLAATFKGAPNALAYSFKPC